MQIHNNNGDYQIGSTIVGMNQNVEITTFDARTLILPKISSRSYSSFEDLVTRQRQGFNGPGIDFSQTDGDETPSTNDKRRKQRSKIAIYATFWNEMPEILGPALMEASNRLAVVVAKRLSLGIYNDNYALTNEQPPQRNSSLEAISNDTVAECKHYRKGFCKCPKEQRLFYIGCNNCNSKISYCGRRNSIRLLRLPKNKSLDCSKAFGFNVQN
ncbi:hypothetical protein Leryth_000967 [Lithospermum erythrorhizon]|nr:hypothetical protein Leryth_000967 [Lithospermum erythrorhizon]